MKCIRILIIFSYRHETIDYRLDLLKDYINTKKLDYIIGDIYLEDLIYTTDNNEILRLNKAYINLENQIKSFNTDVIIFHTGLTFWDNIAISHKLIKKVKHNYPDLRIGVDVKGSLFRHSTLNYQDSSIQQLIDESDEMHLIMRNLFFEK